MINSFDVKFVTFLNSWLGLHSAWRGIFEGVGNNPFARGFLVFFPLIALWHAGEHRERRVRMLAGFLATCAATLISVAIQHHVHSHIRPFLNPTLHLQDFDHRAIDGWDHRDSFPSDTATLFFALSMVILRENRIAGAIAFLWSLFSIGLVRVALGWHYPTDILGGLILGPICVQLSERTHWLVSRMEKLLARFQSRPYLVHAAVFLFLADAYWLFYGLQGIFSGIQLCARSMLTRL
jgi:membrane-associated phospholipid phosphatase